MTQTGRIFVRLPNDWIEQGGLKDFKWTPGQGAANLAALMALVVIAHNADPDTGIARLTYDALSDATGLSRSKLSAGLKVLAAKGIVARKQNGRSGFLLADYKDPCTWGQLPARGLYQHGVITAFAEFKLRQAAELNALKLYLLFVSRRDRNTNMAHITYDQIEERSGVPRGSIKRALNVLAANGLVHMEFFESRQSAKGISTGYRLAHLNTRRHMGTIGRQDPEVLRHPFVDDAGVF